MGLPQHKSVQARKAAALRIHRDRMRQTFRPIRLDDPRGALAKRRDAGPPKGKPEFTFFDDKPGGYSMTTIWVVGGLAAVGGGYLVGRLWKAHRQSQAAKPKLRVVGDAGDVRTADLRGLDVLVSLS